MLNMLRICKKEEKKCRKNHHFKYVRKYAIWKIAKKYAEYEKKYAECQKHVEYNENMQSRKEICRICNEICRMG
jgi:hypothetical protein